MNKNNDFHLHVINIRNTIIESLYSLTHFGGFQNYGVIKVIGVILEG